MIVASILAFSHRRSVQELLDDAAAAGILPERLRIEDSYALPALVPNSAWFVRRLVATPAFARSALEPLLGGTSGGRYAEY